MALKNKKSGFFANADSQKTLHQNLEFTATEQYKLLRANLSFTLPEDKECPIVGVTSAMRGEGKSTTAVNLSYVLAESGKKVLLIDGDLRIPSIAKKMRVDGDVGLTDLLRGGDSVQMNNFKSIYYSNWYIMPAGPLPPNPSELLGSRRMENVLKSLSSNFDFIVLDLPPVNIVSDALTVSKYYFSSLTDSEITRNSIAECIRERLVLVVAQYLDVKGVDIALEAARLDESIEYKFIGMGNKTESFIRKYCPNGQKNIEFIPFLQKEELEAEYRRCSVFVLPSRQECWGLVINEAASFGTPIVSTCGSGAAVEFLSPEYERFLAPVNDAEALYNCICKALESDNAKYSAYLKEKSRKYSIENGVNAHIKACEIER